MEIWHIIILAIIQGITEFLPISSSAHLILFPQLTGLSDQGVAFDVALHVGTLLAVLAYFRKDLAPLLHAWLSSLRTRQCHTAECRLIWGVLVGTIPVGLLGLAISTLDLDVLLREPLIIASSTIVFGLLLWAADALYMQKRDEYSLTWQDILLIGMAQALALIPGTSRSGVTITAALFLGLKRESAARFSFLLSIPVILLAGGVETVELMQHDAPFENWFALLLGVVFSGISAYLCIHAFIKLLNSIGMLPFVIYRLILGFVLLIWYN